MKVVFIKHDFEYDEFFTENKIYEVKSIRNSGNFNVIDDIGKNRIMFPDECVELEEYKAMLVKKRFEQ